MDQLPPRSLIHNPNHQSPAPPTLYQPPSSQQPPVQIPFSDPFSQRRAPDPFLPNTQSQRRGSYGLSSGRDAATVIHGERNPLTAPWPPTSAASSSQPSHQYQSATAPPPPPPSLSSTQSLNLSQPFGYNSTRRRSLGGPHGSETHPLPGGFGRQMPPPSPPQQNQTHHSYAAGRPPPPPAFGSGRDLPGLNSATRPSSGFSISSILGGDPPPSQSSHSQTHQSPPAPGQSPSGSAMHPPSPRRQHSSSFGSFGQWRRPQTPDRRSDQPTGIRLQETLGQPARTSPHPFGSSKNSPEYGRASALYEPYPPPPSITRPAHSPPDEAGRQPIDRAPPRPNSQPIGYGQPRREDQYAPLPPSMSNGPPNGAQPHDHRQRREEFRPGVSSPYNDRLSSPTATRDRPITVQPLGPSAYSPPHSLLRRAPNRDYLRDDKAMEGAMPGRDDPLGGYRGYRELLREPSHGEPPRSHPSIDDPFRRQSEPQRAVNALDLQHNRQMHSHPPDRSFSGEYPRSLYDQPRAPGEEMQRSRSLLGLNDPSRRGRASPLPQAVQGAQPQLTGPAGDPNIKREFGAIFQGLGSGLGAHMPGGSTPSRQSPLPQRIGLTDDITPIVLGDDGTPMSRTDSRGLRKNKRVKDEDSRMEIDGNEGRNTPSLQGAKRTKVGHHHHLPHTHPYVHYGYLEPPAIGHPMLTGNVSHHHHIHGHSHLPVDDLSIPPGQSALTGRFHSATPTAHHHHHIHPPPHAHHHHFPARTASAGPSSHPHTALLVSTARKPILRISSQAVLDSVKDQPRNHLGSELYNPVIEIASPRPASTVINAAKGGIRRVYRPSRVFTENDLNCTFTIRVPRYYLLPAERQRVCADRCLWGCDVYTDDSDPLAAAIHAGWIRGEWSDDVDTAQLGLAGPFPQDLFDDRGSNVPEEINEPPSAGGGYIPPPDMDAHITVVILPQLTSYAEVARNGVLSRNWGKNHDGLSYMIVKVRWVDEGMVRGTARSGKARREQRKRRFAAAEETRKAAVRKNAATTASGNSHMNGNGGDGAGRRKVLVNGSGGNSGGLDGTATTPMAIAAA